jgi:Permuted papain-like amidase enzyme, YaeF/YiiX, C92 family
MPTRRLVLAAAVTGTSSVMPALAQPAETLPLPSRGRFRSGDFLWPKKPGSYVPYHAGANARTDTERGNWQNEQQRFLERQKVVARWMSPQDVDALRSMDFREFHARYAGDQKPGVPGAYATGGGVYVGHVAILEVGADGGQWVIEALWERGVVRQSYDDWLKGRSDQIVWHGRVRDITLEAGARISVEANKYVGRPYDFWNFDLLDDSSFYCSKLAWLATMRSLGIALDDNPEPTRSFWFSPKQFLYSPRIGRLNDPGEYASR